MRTDTQNWIALAEYDLETAHHMLMTGRYLTASIPTRYPEDLQRALKEYPKSVVENYLTQAEQVVRWLKEQLNKS